MPIPADWPRKSSVDSTPVLRAIDSAGKDMGMSRRALSLAYGRANGCHPETLLRIYWRGRASGRLRNTTAERVTTFVSELIGAHD